MRIGLYGVSMGYDIGYGWCLVLKVSINIFF